MILEAWLEYNLDSNSDLLQEHEVNHTKRLIDYLDVVKTPHREAFDMPKLHNDFKQFYQQYDQRRGKNLHQSFAGLLDFGIGTGSVLLEWYDNL